MGLRIRAFIALVAAALLAGVVSTQSRIPQTQPDQLVQIAPHVYFRHGDIDTPEKAHCNNGIIVFKEFVLIIDANHPSGAEACITDLEKAGIRKPARFVFDTHHHGDHSYGNRWYMDRGVIPIAHEGVTAEMARYEPARWLAAAKDRKDVAQLNQPTAMPPILTFPDKMVLDDGEMRVEFYHFGTGHTRGDGFAYLPKQKILFTGDACVNGPYNYMGDGKSDSWLNVLTACQQLDVETVAPGHGPCAGKELLEEQKQYFLALRTQITQGLAQDLPLDQIKKSARVPDTLTKFKGNSFPAQVEKVYKELAGLEMPYELERIGIQPGPSPTRDSAGWKAPQKVVFQRYSDHVKELQRVAPDVKLLFTSNNDQTLQEIADADGFVGGPHRTFIQAGRKLRWVQVTSAGVEPYIGIDQPATPGIPELVNNPDIVLCNARRTYGPQIADHVMGFLLNFTKQLRHSVVAKKTIEEAPAPLGQPAWQLVDPGPEHPEIELLHKTMLIIGAGGIGSEVARRAQAHGMYVIGIDPSVPSRPHGVHELHPPTDLDKHLPRADVVVSCVPLTRETFRHFDDQRFHLMKRGSYFINISRGRIVDTDALVRALQSGHLAGAALDVTDPEPLPDDHPLWKLNNVLITPHSSGQSDGRDERIYLLVRENLRRFAAGEPLLNVVDKGKGY